MLKMTKNNPTLNHYTLNYELSFLIELTEDQPS